MKKIGKILAVLIISSMVLPRFASAVSWSPIQEEHEEKTAPGSMVKGSVVCLFQSGTPDVKKTVKINDVLFVFRESTSHELKEVGKIKVLAFVGDDYLKGEVVEGEVRAGDLAKKDAVASMIISSEACCN